MCGQKRPFKRGSGVVFVCVDLLKDLVMGRRLSDGGMYGVVWCVCVCV